MAKNIILTGMRGTGKTKLGKILAKKLNRNFLDIDYEIEKSEGEKIETIVKEKGWAYFRNLEHKQCKKASLLKNYIIATGGGTIIYKRNKKLLRKNSIILLLTSPINDLKQRVKADKKRPLLTKAKNTADELEGIWTRRKNKYFDVSDYIFDTSNKVKLSYLADKIIKKLKRPLS